MIRFTRSMGGRAVVTTGKNGNGRGCYLCPDSSCLEAAKKKRRLDPSIRIDYGNGN